MTKLERKMMNKEVSRQAHEMTEQFFRNECAVILYSLHEIFGFGKIRLWRFYSHYAQCHKDLCEWYGMNAEEDGHDIAAYLSKMQLERIGVDFDQWEERMAKEQHDNGL